MENDWLAIDVHPSWSGFLDGDRLAQLAAIRRQVGDGCDPAPNRVLRFLELDLHSLRVVILGQDPYPEPGVATGRAFEVGGLRSWLTPFAQTSLRNILRLLYRTDRQMADYNQVPAFISIREQIARGEWKLLPPDRLFADWEEQGVLLLNTCLTVKGEPLQHRAIWLDFMQDLLQYISTEEGDLAWFLWGKSAQAMMPWIELGTIYPSRHPMMCSAKYEDDFLKSDCFRETADRVNWLGHLAE